MTSSEIQSTLNLWVIKYLLLTSSIQDNNNKHKSSNTSHKYRQEFNESIQLKRATGSCSRGRGLREVCVVQSEGRPCTKKHEQENRSHLIFNCLSGSGSSNSSGRGPQTSLSPGPHVPPLTGGSQSVPRPVWRNNQVLKENTHVFFYWISKRTHWNTADQFRSQSSRETHSLHEINYPPRLCICLIPLNANLLQGKKRGL